MREAIGGTWIFGIVVTFIVLFSSYLAISVNYSKAFRVKNQIVSEIEKNEGMSAAYDKIENYLDNQGYYVYQSCGSGWKGYLEGTKSGSYRYCVKPTSDTTGSIPKTYYTVKVFFRLDLPVIGNIFVFPVTGETKQIINAKD